MRAGEGKLRTGQLGTKERKSSSRRSRHTGKMATRRSAGRCRRHLRRGRCLWVGKEGRVSGNECREEIYQREEVNDEVRSRRRMEEPVQSIMVGNRGEAPLPLNQEKIGTGERCCVYQGELPPSEIGNRAFEQ